MTQQQKEHSIHSVNMEKYQSNSPLLKESDKSETVSDSAMYNKCNFAVTEENYKKLTSELKSILAKLVGQHSTDIKKKNNVVTTNIVEFASEMNKHLQRINETNQKIGINVKGVYKPSKTDDPLLTEFVKKNRNSVTLLRENIKSVVEHVKDMTKLVDELDRKINTIGSKKVQEERSIESALNVIKLKDPIDGDLYEISGSPFNKKRAVNTGHLTQINTKTKEYTVVANGRPHLVKKICVK